MENKTFYFEDNSTSEHIRKKVIDKLSLLLISRNQIFKEVISRDENFLLSLNKEILVDYLLDVHSKRWSDIIEDIHIKEYLETEGKLYDLCNLFDRIASKEEKEMYMKEFYP